MGPLGSTVLFLFIFIDLICFTSLNLCIKENTYVGQNNNTLLGFFHLHNQTVFFSFSKVNIIAVAICTRESIKQMAQKGADDGQIININRYGR